MTSREPYRAQRIGNLRERIVLVEPGEETTHPGTGLPVPGVPIPHPVWGRVEPLKGDERIAAGQITAYHEIVFHIRHRTDLTAEWQVEWDGRTYNVTGWRNLDERRRFLAIEAKAVT